MFYIGIYIGTHVVVPPEINNRNNIIPAREILYGNLNLNIFFFQTVYA